MELTVGHIPREISWYVYFFIKQEDGRVYGKLKSLKHKPFPIPSGDLKVPLLLKFKSQDKWVTESRIKLFFRFCGGTFVNDEDEGEIDFEILDVKNSNENNESEINEKDEETVTLDDPITNETNKRSTCCNYWLIYYIKSNKKSQT